MRRLLITGAAGQLGRVMRKRLAPLADTIRLADLARLDPPERDEECMSCDLSDAAAVHEMVAGCDGIVHLGGVSVERPFDQILGGNIVGLYNLYEAARAHGQPRIVFASSNHTIGYYPQTERLGPDAPYRPDGLYGVSKCFGEALARLYFDKFGQETALVRIGSCTPEPTNYRMLSTLSLARRFRFDDRGNFPRVDPWLPGHLGQLGQRRRLVGQLASWLAGLEAQRQCRGPSHPH